MPMPEAFRSLALALAILVAARGTAGAERYAAWLADGTRLTAGTWPAWPVPGTPYRLGDRDLLAGPNPLRLVRDGRGASELGPPWIVMANGDVINGTPIELDSNPAGSAREPRLRVRLESPLATVTGTAISVRGDRIRRITLSADSAGAEPAPGTVVLADGRRFRARAIRWRPYGLAALTAEGVVEAEFTDLADIVLPGTDVAAAVLDDNLWARSLGENAIARMQTARGAVMTAARVSRQQELSRRRGQVTKATYYYIQPAWTDQPIAVPEDEIVCCGYRRANEVPLSLLPGTTLVNRRLIGEASNWMANRSAAGRLLAAGNRESDLGIAAHAHSEIAFTLPPAAVALELAAGLDRSVGPRGCVRCKIVGEHAAESSLGRADDDEQDAPPLVQTLWDSGVLQGSDGPKATGPIDVKKYERIRLVAEFAHAERPAAADPLDIRDEVVWLSPLIRLDPERHTVGSRSLALLPGMAEWNVAQGGWSTAQLASRWNVPTGAWDVVLAIAGDAEFCLSRRLRVARGSDVLELLTVCPLDLDEHDFTLRVDGKPVAWHNNADRRQVRQWTHRYSRLRAEDGESETNLTDRLAYWWDLAPWRGREVELQLTLRGRRERNEIAWRGLALRSAVGNSPESAEPLRAEVPLPTPTERRGNPFQESVRLLGQQFERAWVLPRGSRLSVRLAPEYKRFVAVVGCPQQVAGPVQVLIDGRLVWERQAIKSLAPAEQIDILLPAGAQTLTLQTGSESLYYGAAAFAEAGFGKE